MIKEVVEALKTPLLQGIVLALKVLVIALLFAGIIWCFSKAFVKTKKVVGKNKFLQLTIYPAIAIITILIFYLILNGGGMK